jgi:hypothetical protein
MNTDEKIEYLETLVRNLITNVFTKSEMIQSLQDRLELLENKQQSSQVNLLEVVILEMKEHIRLLECLVKNRDKPVCEKES